MRVLIAGCGYVGCALAQRLGAAGHEAFGLRRRVAALPAGVRAVAADLSEPAGLAAALPGELDAVVYAAAADGPDESAYRRAYVEGLGHLLDALSDAERAPRLLFTSSTSVYGQDAGEWVDESSPVEPGQFRGRVLLEAEAQVHAWPGSHAVVRLGGIYGPGRTRLLDAVRGGRARVPAHPHYTNRIHREDAAGALDHLLKLPSVDPVYLCVDDDPAERAVVLRWLAERLGAPPPPVEEPEAESGRFRPTGKRCRNERLRAAGFRPAFPSFREGYSALIDASSRGSA